MTVRDELKTHITETGESMRALSLRASLNAKAVSDILSIEGLKPRHTTLVALSEATDRETFRTVSAFRGTRGDRVDAGPGLRRAAHGAMSEPRSIDDLA